jgi:multisubunit Na+/H+ antiporter MnhB subunit
MKRDWFAIFLIIIEIAVLLTAAAVVYAVVRD